MIDERPPHDEYSSHIVLSVRTHRSSLFKAFEIEHEAALGELQSRGISRSWWDYKGPEAAPFVIYTRWQPHRVSIANIAGDGTRKGRMPVICEAMEEIAARLGLTCRVEAITNPHLSVFLSNRGYTITPGTEIQPDMVKTL